jgi:hypothetical protein
MGDTQNAAAWQVLMPKYMKDIMERTLRAAVKEAQPSPDAQQKIEQELLRKPDSRPTRGKYASALETPVQGHPVMAVNLFSRDRGEDLDVRTHHGAICAIRLAPAVVEPPRAQDVLAALATGASMGEPGVSLVVSAWNQPLPRLAAVDNFLVVAKGVAQDISTGSMLVALLKAAAAACSLLYGVRPLPVPFADMLLGSARLEWQRLGTTRPNEEHQMGDEDLIDITSRTRVTHTRVGKPKKK